MKLEFEYPIEYLKMGFGIRYNTKEVTDSKRAEAVLANVMGKRLTYRIS